ncbi:MAG TPA: lysylphosphatidylglycerol synthase transmembrane domain-containing protein [Solirubrobacteraceae bacterium]|nr:lysylphosphatidylglycerol synthase transmembrane domain-containing protein [Solirubrobacteraceae bacterium]
MLLSAIVAGGTVVAIAASDSPKALWDAAERIEPVWLAAAFGFELLSYVGYVLAYRSTVLAGKEEHVSLMQTVRLVVAGFGPFVPLGGFSFDRRALSTIHRSRREAHRQVLALGVIEYLLLAPAACVCALVLLLETDKASLVLTLPWVFAVPPGFALAWWVTQPRIVKRFQRSEGKVGHAIGDLLAGVSVLREVVTRPLERPGAVVGMGIYWAAEIACLAYALRCFGVVLSVPALVVAYATGYAASRRSLPLGGAGITEALLTLALITVQVPAPQALLSVVAYRIVNYLVPTLPSLLAHSSLAPMLEGHTTDEAKAGQA